MTEIEQVRRFNRLVTQRVGVLDDEYLGRARSVGASRLLWELPPDGADLRSLRARLGLDSGYLTRLLGRLQAEGLVRVDVDRDDKRVRRARLTAAGRRERETLDRSSDALAESLLAPLSAGQRRRLLAAMADVEQLLTAGLAELRLVDPGGPLATYCWEQYFATLNAAFDAGFDPGASRKVDVAEVSEPHGATLVAMLREEPVGCGSVKHHGDWAEVKRVWVAPSARGLGLARRIMSELETLAAERGATAVRLDTNKALSAAISLYRGLGYVEIPAYNDEPYAHHWFEKRLDGGKS
ncbi:helix-turn-helix domain-containing GNAT family N-acetyltransferase [Nocardioides speluncae]|uniref:helix-turn-helix domain-containing GNAT family N-acetyltransferase n=1 Tax=Nocardioides speluncae TaxID=2670337 RepID=UPI000D69F35D|nr:helix-turn-helix domain-containing GNAT family N-acetyltransferase [Nocardioides speluncae]